MKNSTLYGISLGLTILFTLAALIMLLNWVGIIINGAGRLPFLQLLPWKPLALAALAAVNCTLRAEWIVRGRRFAAGSPPNQ